MTFVESSPIKPNNPYGKTKAAIEKSYMIFLLVPEIVNGESRI